MVSAPVGTSWVTGLGTGLPALERSTGIHLPRLSLVSGLELLAVAPTLVLNVGLPAGATLANSHGVVPPLGDHTPWPLFLHVPLEVALHDLGEAADGRTPLRSQGDALVALVLGVN